MLVRNIIFVAVYGFLVLYVANRTLTAHPGSVEKIAYGILLLIPAVWVFSFYLEALMAEVFSPKTRGSRPLSDPLEASRYLAFVVAAACFLYGAVMLIHVIASMLAFGKIFFFVAIIILLLALLYDLLRYIGIHVDMRANQSNFPLFLLKMAFYVPCLLRGLLLYLQKEMHITSNPVMATVAAEVFALIAIVYFPVLRNTLIVHPEVGGVLVVNEPIQLNRSQSIKPLSAVIDSSSSSSSSGYPVPFSVSCWVFMNHHNSNYLAYAQDSRIFRLGREDEENRALPGLTFRNADSEGREGGGIGTYLVQYENEKESRIQLQIPLSRWTHFVFSYSDLQTFDLFVDGTLAESRKLTVPPKLNKMDFFIVGSDAGLDGALCNLVYAPYAPSLRAVQTQYTLLQSKRPPVSYVTE